MLTRVIVIFLHWSSLLTFVAVACSVIPKYRPVFIYFAEDGQLACSSFWLLWGAHLALLTWHMVCAFILSDRHRGVGLVYHRNLMRPLLSCPVSPGHSGCTLQHHEGAFSKWCVWHPRLWCFGKRERQCFVTLGINSVSLWEHGELKAHVDFSRNFFGGIVTFSDQANKGVPVCLVSFELIWKHGQRD